MRGGGLKLFASLLLLYGSLQAFTSEQKERYAYLNYLYAMESFGDIFIRYQTMFRSRMVIFYVCNDTREAYEIELWGNSKSTFADVPAKGCANVQIGIADYETALPTQISYGPKASYGRKTKPLARFELVERTFKLINLTVEQFEEQGKWYLDGCNASKTYTEILTLTLMDETVAEYAFKPLECRRVQIDPANRYINYGIVSSAYALEPYLDDQKPFYKMYKKVVEGESFVKWQNLSDSELHLCTAAEAQSNARCGVRIPPFGESPWYGHDEGFPYGEKVLLSQTRNASVYSYLKGGVKRLSVSNNRPEMLKICMHSGDDSRCALVASGSSVEFDEPADEYLFTYGKGISRTLFEDAERNDMYAVNQIAAIYYETDRQRYGTHALKLLRFAAKNGNKLAMESLAKLIGEMLERESAFYDAETKAAAEEEMRFWLKKSGRDGNGTVAE